jgi:hypothetical protein
MISLILVAGPSISIYIFIENQQMHQNDRFIVMLSQTLLHDDGVGTPKRVGALD